MRFSQRIGARPPPTSGLEEASASVRIALWNLIHIPLFPDSTDHVSGMRQNARSIWNHIGWPTDSVGWYAGANREQLFEYWNSCDWPEFFDLIEHIASYLCQQRGPRSDQWYATFNSILEAQGCAYRFIGGQLAPLTNPTEVAEVVAASDSAIPAVATHIRDSIRFLPPNAEVSPRNSIKESISAVEAALKNLTGDPSATFKDGLTAFEAKHGELHPSLRVGLLKVYGYTSDEKGIRHALTDETAEVSLDDARFMLVVCSAFANYLVALSGS